MQNFQYRNRKIDLELGIWDAMDTFPKRFKINVLQLLNDMEDTMEAIRIFTLDDETMLHVMHFYVCKELDQCEWEDFLKNVTPKELAEFKDALWQEVINFSGPLKEKMLQGLKKEVRNELKNPKFDKLFSESPPEESTSVEEPSEKSST